MSLIREIKINGHLVQEFQLEGPNYLVFIDGRLFKGEYAAAIHMLALQKKEIAG